MISGSVGKGSPFGLRGLPTVLAKRCRCCWQAARLTKKGDSGFYESILWDGLTLNG